MKFAKNLTEGFLRFEWWRDSVAAGSVICMQRYFLTGSVPPPGRPVGTPRHSASTYAGRVVARISLAGAKPARLR